MSEALPEKLDSESLRAGAKALLALKHQRARTYNPYPKQAEFHQLGTDHRERCLLAGNQLGKTVCAGFEVGVCFATGNYPDWWKGKRFNGPTVGWVGNSSFEQVRDNPQRILLGRGSPEQWGTGMIPKSAIPCGS